MFKRITLIVVCAMCALLSAADWPTDGYNSKRDGWQRDEKILSKGNVAKMKVLWQLQLDNAPNEMHALFPPLIAGKVKTTSGEKQIAVQAGISDNVYGIDVAAGTVIWKKHFDYQIGRAHV